MGNFPAPPPISKTGRQCQSSKTIASPNSLIPVRAGASAYSKREARVDFVNDPGPNQTGFDDFGFLHISQTRDKTLIIVGFPDFPEDSNGGFI